MSDGNNSVAALAKEAERIRIALLLGAVVHQEDAHGFGLTVFIFRHRQVYFDDIIFAVRESQIGWKP